MISEEERHKQASRLGVKMRCKILDRNSEWKVKKFSQKVDVAVFVVFFVYVTRKTHWLSIIGHDGAPFAAV